MPLNVTGWHELDDTHHLEPLTEVSRVGDVWRVTTSHFIVGTIPEGGSGSVAVRVVTTAVGVLGSLTIVGAGVTDSPILPPADPPTYELRSFPTDLFDTPTLLRAFWQAVELHPELDELHPPPADPLYALSEFAQAHLWVQQVGGDPGDPGEPPVSVPSSIDGLLVGSAGVRRHLRTQGRDSKRIVGVAGPSLELPSSTSRPGDTEIT